MLDLSAAYSLYLQDKESALRREELPALLPRDRVAFCDGYPDSQPSGDSDTERILSDKRYYL